MTLAENSESLTCLSLNDNRLTDNISQAASKLLTNSQTLQELYLAWNNLTSVGGQSIFSALSKNSKMRILDFGWNSFGSNLKVIKKNAASFIEEVCRFLRENTSVIHLSLSNNGFSLEES